ncbi:MAG: hypothetical protein WCV84_04055 [Patescibacteria group bacterium]
MNSYRDGAGIVQAAVMATVGLIAMFATALLSMGCAVARMEDGDLYDNPEAVPVDAGPAGQESSERLVTFEDVPRAFEDAGHHEMLCTPGRWYGTCCDDPWPGANVTGNLCQPDGMHLGPCTCMPGERCAYDGGRRTSSSGSGLLSSFPSSRCPFFR